MKDIIINTKTKTFRIPKRPTAGQIFIYNTEEGEIIDSLENGIGIDTTTEPAEQYEDDFYEERGCLEKNTNGILLFNKKFTKEEANKKFNEELWEMYNTKIEAVYNKNSYLFYTEAVIPIIYNDIFFVLPTKPIRWTMNINEESSHFSGNCDHPHLSSSGNICFGDYLGQIQYAKTIEEKIRIACAAINDYYGGGQYPKSIKLPNPLIIKELDLSSFKPEERKLPKIHEFQYGIKTIYEWKNAKGFPQELKEKLRPAQSSLETIKLERMIINNIGTKIILNPKYYNEIIEPPKTDTTRDVHESVIPTSTTETRMESIRETEGSSAEPILSGRNNISIPEEHGIGNSDRPETHTGT